MQFLDVLANGAVLLRLALLRQWDRNPQATLAVGVPSCLFFCWLAWSTVGGFLWPSQRHVWSSVHGTVTSVEGRVVADVTVVFVNDTSGVGASGRTDSSGHYRARGVKPGRYVVALQPTLQSGDHELSREDVMAARDRLEPGVPARFQEAAHSGLAVELKRGSNRYDIDLRGKRR